ncbi:hypothetical protein L195_g056935 [Trifolium pratense]|uniref:Uncharacterized protein n=1 Tax=Trifolium pratense TaxID=57577 RepID=A0A2K3KU87_TRIPR|nr:hypothetical protein L195_g056935 [Trifolium pratense]
MGLKQHKKNERDRVNRDCSGEGDRRRERRRRLDAVVPENSDSGSERDSPWWRCWMGFGSGLNMEVAALLLPSFSFWFLLFYTQMSRVCVDGKGKD